MSYITQIEEWAVEKLKSNADLARSCAVDIHPDDIDSYRAPTGRGLILVRYVDTTTIPEPTQGARRDIVRATKTLVFELQYRIVALRGTAGINAIREAVEETLSGEMPKVVSNNFTVTEPFYHLRGGVLGKPRGKSYWDFRDIFETTVVHQKRVRAPS